MLSGGPLYVLGPDKCPQFPHPAAARASMATMRRATVRTGLGSKACDPSSNAPRTNSACSSDKKYRVCGKKNCPRHGQLQNISQSLTTLTLQARPHFPMVIGADPSQEVLQQHPNGLWKKIVARVITIAHYNGTLQWQHVHSPKVGCHSTKAHYNGALHPALTYLQMGGITHFLSFYKLPARHPSSSTQKSSNHQNKGLDRFRTKQAPRQANHFR